MTMAGESIVDSVTLITTATVLVNGEPTGLLSDIVAGGGTATGGTVTIDTTAAQLRTCSFSCVDPTGMLTPNDAGGGTLRPVGVEVELATGFLVNGQSILWAAGVFGVEEVDTITGTGINNQPGPVLTVTGADRSARVAAALFDDTFTIANAETPGVAISQILASQAPWVVANITPSDFQIAQQVASPGDDPWQLIVSVAQAAGMVAYFDVNGVLVVRPNPSTAGSPVAIALQDGPGQRLTDVTATISNNPGYNGVIVTGSNLSGAPVSGVAYDMDPTSPTYALGPYGKRPAPPVTASTVLSEAQAQSMALTLLPQVLGLTRQVSVNMLPAPFLDAYDIVWINNGETGVNGTYIVQQATLTLDYSALMSMILVPVGAPLAQLSSLQGPSVAQFTSQSPIYAGAGAFTAGAFTAGAAGYSFGTYGAAGTPSTGAGTSGFGASGLLGLGGLGGIGGVGFGALWGGGAIWNRSRWNNSDQAGSVDSNGYVWQSDAAYYGGA